MTVPNYNPLGYTGLKQTRPSQQYFEDRAPLSSDYKIFDVGDEWLDKPNKQWYKLANKLQTVATWVPIGGSPGEIDTITAGNAVVVVPDANSNINLVNGNGVVSTGAGSSITLGMSGTYAGTLTATNFNLSALTGQIQANGNGVFAQASIAVPGPGTYVVSAGSSVLGVYILSWTSANRSQQVMVAVNGIQFDAIGNLNVIYNNEIAGNNIFTGLRLQQTNIGHAAFVVDIGNLAGDTSNLSVTYWGSWATGTNISVLAPVGIVLGSAITFSGSTVGVDGIPGSYTNSTVTNAVEVVNTLTCQTSGTAGNGIGSAQLYRHQQANGTIVNAAETYSICNGAATNVQTSDWRVQTNLAGSLADRLWVNNTGLSTNGINFFGYVQDIFTPTLSFGGSSVGIAYTQNRGTYTRIGNRVFCNFLILLSSKGAQTGTALVSGLPFPTSGNSDDFSCISMDLVTLTASYTYLMVQPNASTLILVQEGSGQSHIVATDANFANASAIQGSFSYQV